ncbi:unnamed protein product, partial [Didymodactylos carnosus]
MVSQEGGVTVYFQKLSTVKIQVRIGGTETTALVDSGATISIVSGKFIRSVHQQTIYPWSLACGTVNSLQFHTKGVTFLNVDID